MPAIKIKSQKAVKKAAARKLAAKDKHGENGKAIENNYEDQIRRFFYYGIVLLISGAAFIIYFSWLDSYIYSHPAVFQANSGTYAQEIPFEGVLLWEEELIYASGPGTVSYPSLKPRRVRKGELLCNINGKALNSPDAGYFIPALDGYEGNWKYSELWPGTSPLPSPPRASAIQNGTYIEARHPVGKLIPHPQELRAIAWVDYTQPLMQDIDRGRVKIKRNENDWGLWAEVRTKIQISQKIKLYVTLPFFTPEMTEARTFSWKINIGDRNGIYVPNSSVIFRNGVMGVYIIKGNEAIFKEVEAFHADEDNFFITSGVIPGDMLILDAGKAREGQVNVW
ncbi:MAG: hypothetical protein FWG09_04495 [Synergistaceae bacterium]|nr:hypothetical protein [Synergistaceae bacterium]